MVRAMWIMHVGRESPHAREPPTAPEDPSSPARRSSAQIAESAHEMIGRLTRSRVHLTSSSVCRCACWACLVRHDRPRSGRHAPGQQSHCKAVEQVPLVKVSAFAPSKMQEVTNYRGGDHLCKRLD